MKRAALIVVAVTAMACGHSAIPAAELGRAENAVGAARASGAEQVPTAALHLKLANENLARARALAAEGESVRARFVLERAAADADLARSLVGEAEAKARAEQAQQEIHALQSSLAEGS